MELLGRSARERRRSQQQQQPSIEAFTSTESATRVAIAASKESFGKELSTTDEEEANPVIDGPITAIGGTSICRCTSMLHVNCGTQILKWGLGSNAVAARILLLVLY